MIKQLLQVVNDTENHQTVNRYSPCTVQYTVENAQSIKTPLVTIKIILGKDEKGSINSPLDKLFDLKFEFEKPSITDRRQGRSPITKKSEVLRNSLSCPFK